MGEDTQTLDEVVVTALGIKRSQKALSYNVQEVKGDELNTVKDANFMNSLAGKVAGVNINASASGVGGATRVVMRGVKSIASDNNALYVIDGVPIFNVNNGTTEGQYSTQPRGEGISDINPDDIESMSVLSGPAAAALYGSSAAQGVILITTKKGQEGKAKVTISNSSTFSKPFFMPKFQNRYGNQPNSFMSWGEEGTATDYDPSSFFNTGTNIQNSVSLSVGNQKNQTYLSVGTTNAAGLIVDNEYNRYNFTVRNTTSFLNDKMTLDAGFSYIIQNDANMIAQGQYFNPLSAVYLFPRGENFDSVRMFETYDEGRKINVQNWAWGTQSMSMQNPYWIAKKMNHGTKKQRYMANASLKYQILDWLDVTGRVRIDNSTSDYEEKRYASTNTLFASETGFYRLNKTDDRQVYADIMANINKRIDDFSLAANIGTSFSQVYTNNAGYQGALGDLPNVFNYYNIDKNGRDTYPLYDNSKHRVESIFASVELGWKSMIYLTVTGRNDWDSSLLGMPDESFFYPSVGLSGVISEMVKLPSFISYMKVRGSFASVGSGLTTGLTSPYSYKWDPATGKWTTKSYKPLDNLYPERTNSWEVGLNAKFLNNKLNFDVTWYRSDTKNQTITVPLSASSSYTEMYAQSGNVRNWGMEFALGFHNNWGDFGWSSNLTFSFNKNEITELLDDYVASDGTHYNIDQIKKGGIDACQYILKPGGTMGDLYVTNRLKRDQEGNVWIDPDTKNVSSETLTDPEKVGSVLPDSNLGFRNDFTWKGFNLGVMLSARFGGVVLSQTQAIMDQYGVSETSANLRGQGGVTVNNGLVDTQKYFSVVGGSNGVLSHYVYSATNVRLQELSLGYTFPRKWFNDKLALNLSVVGRNLWMIYCKAPFDPESTASTGTYYQGLDYFMQPSLRNIGFSVKLQF
ncbi:SusC/RagA family TonB-linked outer membrane protein [Bacteroides thetaiotaomicron]|jgi:tonB-linked outer membrane protein, susC/ragA family|nr:SusC/RagA family TonB-linked outer membrane protein [Bacteroides thetaiotaomicron]MBV3926034.1 SusC/RagA family TonB-linked outer membrane protein [Bacteroides thetaiotaomicron]MBV3930683.1 SusC/RagA family TonB-linked outer membrane protein [Bacteroides thetaiotaomicron]MBV3939737.1 SusC/RagA family TonB-linked outer membrane protein [Bacteroides thetaiotaomicron]MBV3954060.1 SusC/RagA family TonB-linked outer membrane protein [Bacteroides thetaiotaomicron]